MFNPTRTAPDSISDQLLPKKGYLPRSDGLGPRPYEGNDNHFHDVPICRTPSSPEIFVFIIGCDLSELDNARTSRCNRPLPGVSHVSACVPAVSSFMPV